MLYLGACFRSWPKTLDSLKDCTSHSDDCSSYKAEAYLEREHHIFWIKGAADAHFCMPVNYGLRHLVREKNVGR